MEASFLLAVAFAVWLSSLISTRVAVYFLSRRQILDRPNERSSHSTPLPRGLGIGVVPVVVVAWLLIARRTPFAAEARWMCAGALALGMLSWIDDVRTLPAGPRLIAQVLVASFGVSVMHLPGTLLDAGVRPLVLRALMILIWVGLINQVNFTDGIDGNLGAMLFCFGVGVFVTARAGGQGLEGLDVLALAIAAAAGGFLVWNWHPARGFMGDVGSVPLGFLVGWLLLRTVFAGQWAVAVILPLFYFADTFVTYSRRIARGMKFWKPHREYMYQQATRVRTHSRIVIATVGCNVVLILLAIVAARGFPGFALLAATGAVAITYAWLSHGIWWGTAPDRSFET